MELKHDYTLIDDQPLENEAFTTKNQHVLSEMKIEQHLPPSVTLKIHFVTQVTTLTRQSSKLGE